jgi:superfamily I DNA/RNA helicase
MSWWLDLADLDDDQKDVIELSPDGNYLILGPPGSGKTNLLLIRAEYLIRTGKPNVCVLMFNQPLHDFVVRGGVHYEVPANKIKKLMSWEIVLLRENSVNIKDLAEDDLLEKRRDLANRVLALLDSNPKLEHHMSCLLIDEVQDCLPEEIEVFFRCAENVCFAGDSRQRIFAPDDVIPGLRKRAKTVELKTHYRIGHEICRVADVVGKSGGLGEIEGSCNYKGAESKVNFVPCASDEDQATAILESLAVQLKAYPREILAVAAPRIVDKDYFRGKIEASSLAGNLLPGREFGSDDPERRIYVAHVQEIKGLEFRTIHLGRMENIPRLGSNQKRIAYTAITRAKTTVSIYYTGTLPGYLDQARTVVEPPKPKPPLTDLFPKTRATKK